MKRVLVYTAAAVATLLVGTGCEGDFIENGTKIRVTQIEGSRIVVKKV